VSRRPCSPMTTPPPRAAHAPGRVDGQIKFRNRHRKTAIVVPASEAPPQAQGYRYFHHYDPDHGAGRPIGSRRLRHGCHAVADKVTEGDDNLADCLDRAHAGRTAAPAAPTDESGTGRGSAGQDCPLHPANPLGLGKPPTPNRATPHGPGPATRLAPGSPGWPSPTAREGCTHPLVVLGCHPIELETPHDHY